MFLSRKQAPEDHWYELRPYMVPQFKDNYQLYGPPFNFVWVLSVDSEKGWQMFMRAPGNFPSTNEYQAIPYVDYVLKEPGGDIDPKSPTVPFKFYKYNFELKVGGVYPAAMDVVRDKVYNVMNQPEMQNTVLIVVAQRIFSHPAIDNEYFKAKERRGGNMRLITQSKTEAKFLCHIFVSSDNIWAARNLKDNAFPAAHTPWFIKGSSVEKMMKYLVPKYKLSYYPHFDRFGSFLNLYCGNSSTMRDTVVSTTTLDCLVSLPLNRMLYPLQQGETMTGRSQNMALASEDEEFTADNIRAVLRKLGEADKRQSSGGEPDSLDE